MAGFERFVRMCAARSGQLLNIQSLEADCGISASAARLCHLLRIEDPLALATHAMRGAIFETWVLSETLKH